MADSLHTTEYYTGAQVKVYFGHLLIDEIASMRWLFSQLQVLTFNNVIAVRKKGCMHYNLNNHC